MIPMNKCGIYMITSPSGKSYIGRSLNLEERLNKYKNLLCSDQQYIYHAILKYGWDNMKVTILIVKKGMNYLMILKQIRGGIYRKI